MKQAIKGIIDRRILVNYRIDPRVMSSYLPRPFRPKIKNGFAIGGICLIRLKNMQPGFTPSFVKPGFSSENAAHRMAVEWETCSGLEQGVFVPRRDTNSALNLLAGKFFPGDYHKADFKSIEKDNELHVQVKSDDKEVSLEVKGKISECFPESSIFADLDDASDFFEAGSIGYSQTSTAGQFDGLDLQCKSWNVKAIDIEVSKSSFFSNEDQFPAGSVEFDCALYMQGIEHEWHSLDSLSCFGRS